MKIAILGATGNAGQRLVTEALSRGHTVTGISRHADTQASREGVTWVTADINDTDDMAGKVAGHDAAILSMPFKDLDSNAPFAVARKSGTWLLIVRGAASLKTEAGDVLIDTPVSRTSSRSRPSPRASSSTSSRPASISSGHSSRLRCSSDPASVPAASASATRRC